MKDGGASLAPKPKPADQVAEPAQAKPKPAGQVASR